METAQLPVAVIGAGPVGLAAAAHLIDRGETPLVFEAGATAGASVLEWGHVRLFSPWEYNIDPVARGQLAAAGWTPPAADEYPTGRELVERYLAPLAALPAVAPHLRLGARVVAVTRQGFDKMKTPGREAAPFLLQVETAGGGEEQILARAVIDASGTWRRANPLGSSGLPAPGERALAGRIFYGIPDPLGAQRARYAGRRILVVGSGHSAFNAILDLAILAEEAPGTTVLWAVRRANLEQLFGGGGNDALAARGALGARVRGLVESGAVRVVTGFRIARLVAGDGGVTAVGEDAALPPVDEIVATTGFRPDLAPLAELRLALDPGVESPVALAPLIDPNFHSCGTVRPHGAEELAHPERDFYLVGMKSYGRAPTFLMLTGYEQVRSVVAALVGDWAGAREVRLELPATGVCSTSYGEDAGACGEAAAACCGPATAAVHAGVAAPALVHLAAPRAAGGGGGCCG